MPKTAHQRSKYKKLNKAFANNKTFKEETVILYDTSESNFSSRSKIDNPPEEYEKTSIAYNSDSADDDEISSIPLAARTTINSTVAEMHLSIIN